MLDLKAPIARLFQFECPVPTIDSILTFLKSKASAYPFIAW